MSSMRSILGITLALAVATDEVMKEYINLKGLPSFQKEALSFTTGLFSLIR